MFSFTKQAVIPVLCAAFFMSGCSGSFEFNQGRGAWNAAEFYYQPPHIKRKYQAALDVMSSGDMEKAAAAFEDFDSEYPGYPGAYVNLAIIYEALERPDDADAMLDEAGWESYTAGAMAVAKAVKEATGLRSALHPHGATHVETMPAEGAHHITLNLCSVSHRNSTPTPGAVGATAWPPSTNVGRSSTIFGVPNVGSIPPWESNRTSATSSVGRKLAA